MRRLRLTLLGLMQEIRILVYELVSTNKLSGQGLRIIQPVHALGSGKITIGHNVTIGWFPSPGYFSGSCHIEVRSETAEIFIGDGTYLNNDVTAIAEAKKIAIGHRCLIGPRVTIFDSDFHVLRVADRMNAASIVQRSVKIGDDVFIGAGAIVLKGVSIGDGAVIGAGAVVVSDIPPNVIAAGNPATVVRSL